MGIDSSIGGGLCVSQRKGCFWLVGFRGYGCGMIVTNPSVGAYADLTDDKTDYVQECNMLRKQENSASNGEELLEDTRNANGQRGSDINEPILANE